jgi:hypothetical protein
MLEVGDGDMILGLDRDSDFVFVNNHWSDFTAMTYGRFDICDMEGNFDYSAARKFTEDRLEEIRKVEEELEWLHTKWLESDIVRRILKRERNCLMELKQGMKI